MVAEKMGKGGTCNAVETGSKAFAVSPKSASDKPFRKSGAKTSSSPVKFGRGAGIVAESIYASVAPIYWPELSVELSNSQSLFELSHQVQLSDALEVNSPALVHDVPSTQTAHVLIHPRKRTTEFRRERAPLAGHLGRHHDESRAARCAPRSLGSQADD